MCQEGFGKNQLVFQIAAKRPRKASAWSQRDHLRSLGQPGVPPNQTNLSFHKEKCNVDLDLKQPGGHPARSQGITYSRSTSYPSFPSKAKLLGSVKATNLGCKVSAREAEKRTYDKNIKLRVNRLRIIWKMNTRSFFRVESIEDYFEEHLLVNISLRLFYSSRSFFPFFCPPRSLVDRLYEAHF